MIRDTQVIHESSHAFPEALPVEHLDELRRAFLTLMDAAAAAVQRAGYDLDDCVVERFVTLRYQGDAQSRTIEAESLTELDRLLRPFHRDYCAQFEAPRRDDRVEVVRIAVRARRCPRRECHNQTRRGR
jgi:N-methylhydantoinase A/oxoprolinase/acetone carboxylase beta subunit